MTDRRNGSGKPLKKNSRFVCHPSPKFENIKIHFPISIDLRSSTEHSPSITPSTTLKNEARSNLVRIAVTSILSSSSTVATTSAPSHKQSQCGTIQFSFATDTSQVYKKVSTNFRQNHIHLKSQEPKKC